MAASSNPNLMALAANVTPPFALVTPADCAAMSSSSVVVAHATLDKKSREDFPASDAVLTNLLAFSLTFLF